MAPRAPVVKDPRILGLAPHQREIGGDAALYLACPTGYRADLFRAGEPRERVQDCALTRKPAAAPDKPGLDVAVVAELAKVVGEYDLSEIEVEHEGLKIRVARERRAASVTHLMAPSPMVAAPPPSPADHPGAVKSPMVGTAYLRPSPEAKPFVEIGAEVKSGDKLLLVEAMKTFNEIVAPRAGKITQILVENCSPVEYDQPLMIIE